MDAADLKLDTQSALNIDLTPVFEGLDNSCDNQGTLRDGSSDLRQSCVRLRDDGFFNCRLNGRPLAILLQQFYDASGGNPKVGWSPRELATRFNQAVSFHYLETNIKVLLINSSELRADSIGAKRFIRGR